MRHHHHRANDGLVSTPLHHLTSFFPREHSIMISRKTLRQIKKDFCLVVEDDTYEVVVPALYDLGFTHTFLNYERAPVVADLLFNPWTMEILSGPYAGRTIITINGLPYDEYFDKVKPFLAAQHRSRLNMKSGPDDRIRYFGCLF